MEFHTIDQLLEKTQSLVVAIDMLNSELKSAPSSTIKSRIESINELAKEADHCIELLKIKIKR